jgi:hypothetical protein
MASLRSAEYSRPTELHLPHIFKRLWTNVTKHVPFIYTLMLLIKLICTYFEYFTFTYNVR